MRKFFIISEVSQWTAAGVVLAGIICEVIFKADLYLMLITGGSLGFAVCQKIKHPSRLKPKKEDQNGNTNHD